MSLPVETKRRYTVSEYLRYEQDAKEKHEYRQGEIVAMAGGTYHHSLISTNTVAALHSALRGKPCRVLESNMRVRAPRVPFYTYPDASIVCGKPEFDESDRAELTLMNPRVLIEVLSPSTEGYDRGEKFAAYRQFDSMEEYVLISQDTPRVETYLRQADGSWTFNAVDGLEAMVRLKTVGVEIKLSEIYDGVTFPAPRPDAAL